MIIQILFQKAFYPILSSAMKEFVCSDKRSFRRFVCTLLCWLLGGTDKFDLVFHIRAVGRSRNREGGVQVVMWWA